MATLDAPRYVITLMRSPEGRWRYRVTLGSLSGRGSMPIGSAHCATRTVALEEAIKAIKRQEGVT